MTKAHKNNSLGDRFRNARKRAADIERSAEKAKERKRKQRMRATLSSFFNHVAKQLPDKVESLLRDLDAGKWVDPCLSFRLSDGGDYSLSGVDELNLAALPSFKALDKATKDLNVEGIITVKIAPINDESPSNYHAVVVTFDVENRHKPLQLKKYIEKNSWDSVPY